MTMMIAGTYFAERVQVVKAAAIVSPRGEDQWELAIQVPWQSPEYTVKGWADRTPEDPQTGPMGEHRSLFFVQGLLGPKQDGTIRDGSAPWDYAYRLRELDYDGPDAENPPRMGGMPPIPSGTYTPQPQRATQPPSPVQQPSTDWQRRDISIKWGQAVNLAAQWVGDASQLTSEDLWPKLVAMRAYELFPLLIEWDKEAVDAYFAEPEPPAPEAQREQEMQNAETPLFPNEPETTQDEGDFVQEWTEQDFNVWRGYTWEDDKVMNSDISTALNFGDIPSNKMGAAVKAYAKEHGYRKIKEEVEAMQAAAETW